MAQTICRMYGTRQEAEAALEELRLNGYDDCFLFAADAGSSQSSLVDAMCRAHILKYHAQVYADRVAKGGALVMLHAEFGMALKATQIMERHQTIDSGVAEPVEARIDWDDSIPLSSALQLPVLLETKYPFEAFWNFPSLIGKGWTLSRLLGMPMRTASPTPLSSSVGMPMLTRGATPFSSLFKLPVLSSR
jgi:hypothetical protein